MADNVTVESVSIEFKGTVENFQSSNDQLISILEKLEDALKNATESMSTFNDSTKKTGENIKSIKDTGKSSASSALKLAGLGASAAIAKRKVYELMTASADFVNTQLRFNSTFAETNEGLQEAQQFVEDYSNALYLNEEEVMNAMATYKLLTRNMGISNEASSKMSKNLTQLSYDLAAFTNTDVNQIVTDLRSGVSGQAEAMQKYGVSLNQATLQSTLYANGIDRTVASLNSAERAELMYYQIMTATAGVQGYYAKSFMTPAVALSTVKNQFRALAREIGNVFIPILMALTPYVVALTQLLRQLAQAIAAFFGIDISFDSVSQGIGAITGGIDNIGDSADKTKKKIKNMLRDFDELHVVDFGDDSASGSGNGTGTGAGAGGLGLDVGEYANYNTLMDEFNQKVEKAKEILTAIGITLAAYTVSKAVLDFLKALELLPESLNTFAISFGIALMAAGVYLLINGLNKILEGEITPQTIGETILGAFGLTAGAYIVLTNILSKDKFGKTVSFEIALGITFMVAGATIFANGIKQILEGKITPKTIGQTLLGAFGVAAGGTMVLSGLSTSLGIPINANFTGIAGLFATFAGLFTIVTGLGVAIYGVMQYLENPTWQNFATILAGIGIVAAGVGLVFGGIPALITLIIGAIIALGLAIYTHFDQVKDAFNTVVTTITDFVTGIADKIYNSAILPIIEFLSPIIEALGKIFSTIITNVVDIVKTVVKAIETIVKKIGEIVLKVVEIAAAIFKTIYNYVIKPIIQALGKFGSFIDNKVFAPLKEVMSKVHDLFWEKFSWLGTAIVDTLGGLLKGVLNGIFASIESKVNGFIRLLNGAVGTINKIPGVNITTIAEISLPRFASGGFPEQGELFIANEAGPELVGSMGNRSVVANNKQIIAGVAQASYDGMKRALQEVGMNEGDTFVYVGGKQISDVVTKKQKSDNRRYGR